MSEPISTSETQPLHLLPDELFQQDKQAMNQAPESLKGIPFWKFEQFIQLLPLAKKYGEIINISSLSNGGRGQEGSILHLKLGQKNVAIKLMYSFPPHIEPADYQKLVDVGVYPSRPENWEPEEESDEDMEWRKETFFRQTNGQKLGNSLEPEYVPPLLGIFTYKEQPIGYVMPFIEGQSCNVGDAGLRAFPDSDNEERAMEIIMAEVRKETIELRPLEIEAQRRRKHYYDALDHLKEGGVHIDYADPARNAIVTDGEEGRGIKLVDLAISD